MNTAPTLSWPWETPAPGIYFNMPFEVYTKIPCLNASGIKNILVSETDFWSRSWMNPLLDEIDEETKAKIDGRAYHTRILEGRKAFYDLYAPAYEEDLTDLSILRTNTDMTNFIKMNGGKGYSGKTAPELANMCLDIDPEAKILAKLKQDHIALYPDKEFLDARTIRLIELSAKMIEHHPELKSYFVGGYPEVTIIWDDPEFGVRFKIRIDYLKIGPVGDLKTFANVLKKSIERAIQHAVAAQKYHIQGWLYLRGVNIAKQMAKQGLVYGAEEVSEHWLSLFSNTPSEEFWYIFQQKGIAPVSRGAKWSIKDQGFNRAGYDCIADASARFRKAYSTFGTDAWVDLSESKFLDFSSLPAFVGDV